MPLVTKFAGDHKRELVDACEMLIEQILEGCLPVVTDAGGEIFDEYLHQLSLGGQPSLGDQFVRYVHERRYSWSVDCRPDLGCEVGAENRYAVLDGDDSEFDPSDRKFVAAAKVAGVPVVQATDSKWLNWGDALRRHGVEVQYVHEPSIRAAYLHKFGVEAPGTGHA